MRLRCVGCLAAALKFMAMVWAIGQPLEGGKPLVVAVWYLWGVSGCPLLAWGLPLRSAGGEGAISRGAARGFGLRGRWGPGGRGGA